MHSLYGLFSFTNFIACYSAQFVLDLVVYILFGLLHFTVCIWAVQMHILYIGCCNSIIYMECCSAQFLYGLLYTIFIWAVVLHSLYMGCFRAKFVCSVVVQGLYMLCINVSFVYGLLIMHSLYGLL